MFARGAFGGIKIYLGRNNKLIWEYEYLSCAYSQKASLSSLWMLIYTWATYLQNDSEYLSHLMASRIIDVDYYAGGDRKVVTSVDVYKSIRALQLEGVTSQRAAAKILGISRNTVKKYWMGDAVPWDRKAYQREASVITPEVMNYRNLENRIDVTIREG